MKDKYSLLAWLASLAPGNRYKINSPAPDVLRRTMIKSGRNSFPALEPVSPAKVISVARTLEAQLVMAEGAPLDQTFMLEIQHEELLHFVHYMRQLDRDYRELDTKYTVLGGRFEEMVSQNVKTGASMPPVAIPTCFEPYKKGVRDRG